MKALINVLHFKTNDLPNYKMRHFHKKHLFVYPHQKALPNKNHQILLDLEIMYDENKNLKILRKAERQIRIESKDIVQKLMYN